jgi:hypothetical protein
LNLDIEFIPTIHTVTNKFSCIIPKLECPACTASAASGLFVVGLDRLSGRLGLFRLCCRSPLLQSNNPHL